MSGHGAEAPASGIAIIGMACRLPGARSHGEFWENLCAGRESIRFFTDEELLAAGVPPTALRRPDYVKAAPLLHDVDLFDAEFFGYSPREAALIDPQHRLFLEVAWDTFEDAGYDPGSTGADVGVFAGGGGVVTSYMMAHGTHEAFPGQTGGIEHISNDKDFLSTRVSYKLDLTGPSVTVQTACSTSLVALHLACQSIRTGECDMALAGASTIRIPHVSGYLAPRGGIYSSDGRCRAFDANGTGTIFGSGVAAVLLKGLQEAIEDGDHIHAVIRSTAVNNDGGRKVSYTAPSVVGEARAMAEALSLAGVPAESIRFVECHATGTTVGDPLEVQALTRAFRTRTKRVGYCAMGSAKTNIGHAEQAAGMAGLIKTALVLEHGVIPPTRVETPNPSIPFEGSPFFLNRELAPWPGEGSEPRRAAVNSLGIGGTNAFAVLEQAPQRRSSSVAVRDTHVLCLSARSADALRARAAQFAKVLAEAAPHDVPAICHTVNASRSGFSHRFAVAGTADTMRSKLEAFAASGEGQGMTSARAQPGPVAFLFSGQGFQYPGMARALYSTQPTFRAALDRCGALARPYLERDLVEVMLASDESGWLLHQTGYTQPALFAVEYALAQTWASWGVAPAAVMGHSIGEIAACCVAGVYGLEEGIALVSKRAALMQGLSEPGGMLAVLADEEATLAAVGEVPDLAVAAINGPTNTVVSGPQRAIGRAQALLAERRLACKRLEVSHAFHSGLMDPILDDLDAVAAELDPGMPAVPVVTNVTGALLEGAPSPRHWGAHARGAVRFDDGIRTLAELGITTFLEIGPGPGLLALGRRCLPGSYRWIPSLDPKRDDWAVLLESLRQLHLAGHSLQWDEVDRGFDRRRMPLPTYPFQRKRYWLSDEPFTQRVAGSMRGEGAVEAPAAFERAFKPDGDVRAALRDHQIHGEVVFPTMLIVTEALAEGREWMGSDVQLENLKYHRALVLGPQVEMDAKLVFTPEQDGSLPFRLLARHAHGAWQQHAEGRIVASEPTKDDLAGSVPRPEGTGGHSRDLDAVALYPMLRAAGLDYGTSLRSIRELCLSDGQAWFHAVPPGESPSRPLAEQPFLLDACLHPYPVLAGDCLGSPEDASDAPPYLPVGVERVRIFGAAGVSQVDGHARLRAREEDQPLTLDIRVHDEDGQLLALLEGLSLVRVPPDGLRREGDEVVRRSLYKLAWRETPPTPAPPTQAPGAWLLLADRGGVAERVAADLEAHGQRCRLVRRVDPATPIGTPHGGPPVRGDDPRELAAILHEFAGESDLPLRGVVNAWALDGSDMEDLTPPRLAEAIDLGLKSTLFLIQALGSDEALASTRLWTLARGATSAGDAVEPVDAVQGALSGLGRTLALEHPRSWGGVIDLGPIVGDEIPSVIRELLLDTGETEVSLREGGRYVPRLVPWTSEADSARRPVRTDGTFLVTGGLGMIGRETARWLVERHGVRDLLLTGRSGAGHEARRFLDELAHRGVNVTVIRADVSDPDDVARVFRHIDASPLPLRGIVHSAGVLADGIASHIEWKDFARALAPKIQGSWLLHHHSEDRDMDLFLVHSSILSWTGSVGQANYTAGNAFLDALVDHRRAKGLPGMTINWGPWAETGMATQSGARGEEIWRRLGVEYIERETGVRALALLHDSGTDHGGLTLADWSRYVTAQPASSRFLGELTADESHSPGRESPVLRDVPAWSREARGDELQASLVQALCAQAALELGFAEPISADVPLSELGLDSLISVNLANRIERSLGLTVPLVHLVQGPSVDELVERLATDPDFEDLSTSAAPTEPLQPLSSGAPATNGHPRRGSVRPRGARSPARWLVFPKPRPEAEIRLFCFPYAGAGAPVFQSWADSLDPSIELVAVEPPGRAGRIEEEPVADMAQYVDGLMPDLERYLDKPVALFGHCQGAINLYEVTRALVRNGTDPAHLFVSGARPPHQLFETGLFEEALAESLLEFEAYDPLLPLSEQPEEVFGAALRHFDIGATEQFLTNPELRALVLPAVRADFETIAGYSAPRDEPWNVPITCLLGLSDTYVSRRNAVAWSEYTQAMFKVHYLDSTHYMVVEDRDAIIAVINHDLLAGRAALRVVQRSGHGPDGGAAAASEAATHGLA